MTLRLICEVNSPLAPSQSNKIRLDHNLRQQRIRRHLRFSVKFRAKSQIGVFKSNLPNLSNSLQFRRKQNLKLSILKCNTTPKRNGNSIYPPQPGSNLKSLRWFIRTECGNFLKKFVKRKSLENMSATRLSSSGTRILTCSVLCSQRKNCRHLRWGLDKDTIRRQPNETP